jgi:2-keto-4-pentenoate hydratase
MAAAATIDLRRLRRSDWKSRALCALVSIRRRSDGVVMASAAHRGGDFDARHQGRIIGIGGVIGGRAVAVFALHARQVAEFWPGC